MGKQFDINLLEEQSSKQDKHYYEDLPLHLQIMHELKMSSRRWFVIAMAELIVIVIMLVVVFVVPAEVESSITQEISDIYDTENVTQTIGE